MSLPLMVVSCLLVAGCLQPGSVVCGNDRVCPSTHLCDEEHHLCVLPDQLTACEAKVQNEPCSTATVSDGACFEGVCLSAGCANSVIEPGEVCDDGNTANGDGCSADCTSDETCGNGITDPATGEGCDDGNAIDTDGCHTNCSAPVCGDGIVDTQYGESCDAGTANSLASNAACRPNCQPARCGDGVKDPMRGEICDDGNLAALDGCTPDCLSNETCRNGYFDYLAGELCDDANAMEGDGCSPECRLEQPMWARHEQDAPGARMVPALAYDPVRDRVVMFGGGHSSAAPDNVTWELAGDTWIRRYPARSPPGRVGGAMAYDASRGVMVLFGGYNNNDTWEWDGTNWSLAVPAGLGPPARMYPAMAYDARRHRVVMTGGGYVDLQSNSWTLDNSGTWEWDGSAWSKGDSVGGRVGQAMTFNPVSGHVVLYGLSQSSAEADASLLEWDGSSWTDITAAGPSLTGVNMVFDPTLGTLILAGGYGNTTTYKLTASGWTALAGAMLPARGFTGLVARTTRGDLFAFGGGADYLEFPSSTAHFGDSWHRDAAGWSVLPVAPALPPAHTEGSCAYDVDRGTVVAFGGTPSNGTAIPNSTYLHRNDLWTTLSPVGSPPPRRDSVMAYDEARKQTVMFGGIDGGLINYNNETWLFDAALGSWAQRTPSPAPLPRRYAMMAYDSKRKRVVLFGGADGVGPSSYFGDTWEWDGTNWLDKAPSVHPGARAEGTMAFDPVRGAIVLYGGYSFTAGGYVDTWQWNGLAWTQLTTPVHPRGSYDMSTAYDAARQRIVLYGGRDPMGDYDDTWELTGSTWTRADVLTQIPTTRNRMQLAADPAGRQLLVTGGGGPTAIYFGETWSFRYGAREARMEWCQGGLDGDHDGLAGCADPDCWVECTPHCPPGAITPCDQTQPRCGDGACSVLESNRLCPADCGVPATACGDWVCDQTETATTCPGDCP